jgi:DNA polymerase-3 subunit beta
MKFICEKSALIREIAIAQEIIGSKNTMNVLSNIFLEAANDTLVIKSTDITVYFETKVPISVVKAGEATVRGNLFFGILNSISDGELEFERIDNEIIIKPVSSKTEFKLRTNSSDQYPESPAAENLNSFDLPIKDFKEMITQTIFAVSDDETRYLMNGVCFEKTESKYIMVATDGRRMAYIEKVADDSVEDFKGVIIPEKILGIVQKYAGEEGNVKICITEKHIFIYFGSYSFTSSLIEGKFPDYRRVVPTDHDKSFSVNKKDMINALKRASLFVEQKNKRIWLKLISGEISVCAQDGDTGGAQDTITTDYEGDGLQMALNYQYIEEPCKIISSDEIVIHFKDPTKAITIKAKPERDYFHIVMPMQTD